MNDFIDNLEKSLICKAEIIFCNTKTMQSVILNQIVVIQLLIVWLFVTPMDHSTPGFPVLHYLPELA